MLYCDRHYWCTVGGWPFFFTSNKEGSFCLSSIPQEGRVIVCM
jgi:hypothetical protein